MATITVMVPTGSIEMIKVTVTAQGETISDVQDEVLAQVGLAEPTRFIGAAGSKLQAIKLIRDRLTELGYARPTLLELKKLVEELGF